MNPKKHNEYEFKYEGDFKGLDALTVLHTQLNFVTILREIKEYKYPEINLDIKIEGTEQGSLDISHIIDVVAVSGMFVMENYKYVSGIFKIFSDIVRLKKFLKGKKADKIKELKGDKVEIHINGDNIHIDKDAIRIYQNNHIITNALANTSKMLADQSEVDSIEVTQKGKNKSLVNIDKSDFQELGEDNPYLIKEIDNQKKKDQILFIKKPNLFPAKNKKWVWELIHSGRDIKANIIDKKFEKQINDGLKVGQGDRIKATLVVYYKFDERFQTFIETGKYEVIDIEDIIERPSLSDNLFEN